MVSVTSFTLDNAIFDTILSLFQIPSNMLVLNNNKIHNVVLSINENLCQEDKNVQFDNFGICIQYYSRTKQNRNNNYLPKIWKQPFSIELRSCEWIN